MTAISTKHIGYLRLIRPANIITAIADILAGYAISMAFTFDIHNNLFSLQPLFWLILSTMGLYGGGVVFNDIFDVETDKIERPERPIPSGISSIRGAVILGTLFFSIGVIAAYMVSITSFSIAILILVLALFYNKFSKHHAFFGPLNMGACRGFNLLLGMSVIPGCLSERWFIALIPVVYISSITMISRGEVHGGNSLLMKRGGFLYLLVIIAIMLLGYLSGFSLLSTLPFLILFFLLIFPPLLTAIKQNKPGNIRYAVKAGIMSLVAMNAAIAAGFAGWQYGLIVLCLLPLSVLIARRFSVT